MRPLSNHAGTAKERFGFLLFALFIGSLVWLTHSGASNSPTTLTEISPGQNKQLPSGCKSCPPPSPRKVYAPAIDLNEAQSCEIVLNSRSSQAIDVTPTFYTASGDAIVGNPIQLQPAEIRFVNVEELMPESIRGTHRWGGIALSYTGHVLEVWAQITFHGIGGGSIDETFNILEEPGSDTREAVWLMPRKSTAIIALGNTSPVAIHTTAQFGEATEDLEIPAGVTKFIRRRSHGRNDDAPESVKLTTVGPDGALRVAGFIVSDDNDFASSIRFYDTKKTVQSNLYAVNLRLRNAKPRIVLENTSDIEISAQPKFSPLAGDQTSAVELPNVTIGPRQIVELDLSPLRQATASRTDLDSVYGEILSSAAPGSLIGAAYSELSATGTIYDVPLRDSGKVRNATGSYPWRVDNDYSTNVVLTNVGNIPAKFQVELRYPGGPYSIKQRELAVGESASFDLRAIRDEQQPDRTGKTLPETINGGQFHWSIVATPGDARIVGRAEVVSRSQHVVSSYSCPVCCPDSGPNAYFNPNAYPLYVDGVALVGADGTYWDCYFNYYTGSAYWSSLWTMNTSVATANSGTSELQGVGAGNTDVVGDYQYVYWDNDGMDCYQRFSNGSDSAPVDVTPRISQDKQLWFFGYLVDTPPSFTLGSARAVLTANGATTGTFQWTVTQGSDKIMIDDTFNITTVTKTDVNTLNIRSISYSTSMNDVTIRLSYTAPNASQPKTVDWSFSIDSPYKLIANGSTTTRGVSDCTPVPAPAGTDGFQTVIPYKIISYFGVVVTHIGINESFFSFEEDYPGENWPTPNPNGAETPDGTFKDNICIVGVYTPMPLVPQSPLSSVLVDRRGQSFSVGGVLPASGLDIQTDYATRYQDHGAHQNITSPVR